MKSIIRKLLTRREHKLGMKLSGEEQLKRQVTAVYGLLANLMGSDKLVMKAGKLDALHLMRSDRLESGTGFEKDSAGGSNPYQCT